VHNLTKPEETVIRITSSKATAEHTKGLSSFGSSAILFKTRRFLPPSHGGFGFVGIVSS